MTGAEPAVSVTWEQVLAFRLGRHLLAGKPGDAGHTVTGVASRLCGLHAQIASCAELAVTVRSDKLRPGDVAAAVTDRALVKTWAMRGTLHLLPAAEMPLWTAAGRMRRGHLTPSWLRYQGVTRDELDAIQAAIPEALSGAELTREELAIAVSDRIGRPEMAERLRSGWGDLFKPSAYRGDLCFGSGRGRNVTFVNPRDWVDAEWDSIAPDAALVEVVRRFVAAYGPVAREDFARWWGCQPAEAGRAMAALGDELTPVDVAGHRGFVRAVDLEELMTAALPRGPHARLLPGFDPYVVAACPRNHEALLPPERKEEIYRPQGWISAVLLDRGRICGVWRHEQSRAAVTLSLQGFGPVAARTRKAFGARAESLAHALGGTARTVWADA
ncbi:winged helix DNA-binding domain-containing protein [Plantactinospora sp. DSM 117369]